MRKWILLGISIVGLVTSSYAQSEKMKENAQNKVDELNASIVAEDTDLVLSTEQRDQLYNEYLEMLMDVKKVKKSGGDKEELKAARKKHNKAIFGDILTKEQRKARRKNKKSSEEEE
ncbi:hypothetical protein HX109_12950 [Galbibacter sp. BG1]|uniref:hypothetical protein n=1 Tax=Galbibacter sp. BG1 TaxID=1170699 RepID=UPI0015B8AC15|nr:hypothetical protein [Galbibacter sp. BG1]QLE02419.1 hypothetical protein HX109_12950 [Galbibacter sp. BG1]